MGNGNGTRHGYEIKTKTGDKKGMGTDVHIYITLISEDGRRSHDLYLDCKWRNDFEAGAVDTFPFGDEVPDIGPIAKVEIHRYSTFLASEWFMEWVEITNHYRPEDKPDIFPFQRWVKSGVRFTVCRYDSVKVDF
jgi:arachidonate 5-lipoxygenase